MESLARGSQTLSYTMENWYIPYQTAELPSAKKVWVLAPHPDDEVFGCAGAILTYAAQGAAVQVCVVSSGTGYAKASEALQIQATREAETNAALQVMGISQASFLQLPDRGLSQCANLANKFLQVLERHQFDVVLAPSLEEVHPDHLAVTRALLTAFELLKAQGSSLPCLLQYEVGAPLRPNLLLDISSVWPTKQKAMACFQSQLAVQNYAAHIEALNVFRTYSLPATVSHAEAYCVLSPNEVLSADTQSRWMYTVLSAADAGAEAMQLQVLAQNLQMENLQNQWRIDNQAMREHADTLLKRVDVLVEELVQVGIENERKRIEIERLVQETSRVHEELIANLTQVQAALVQEQDQLQVMLQSNSWRLTKPLRWLVRRFSSSQS